MEDSNISARFIIKTLTSQIDLNLCLSTLQIIKHQQNGAVCFIVVLVVSADALNVPFQG